MVLQFCTLNMAFIHKRYSTCPAQIWLRNSLICLKDAS